MILGRGENHSVKLKDHNVEIAKREGNTYLKNAISVNTVLNVYCTLRPKICPCSFFFSSDNKIVIFFITNIIESIFAKNQIIPIVFIENLVHIELYISRCTDQWHLTNVVTIGTCCNRSVFHFFNNRIYGNAIVEIKTHPTI